MILTDIYNIENEKIGEINLSKKIFGLKVDEHILHSIVRMQLANRRSGNACTKTRVEVNGSSVKPYKQKGTGRARSGSKRSPLWRGGGVSHGPTPRDYSIKLSKKIRRLALRMALSARVDEKNLKVIDNFDLDEIKTKKFVSVMRNFDINNALVVIDGNNLFLEKSARNVKGFKVLSTLGLNVYDVLHHEHLVLLKDSLNKIESRLLP